MICPAFKPLVKGEIEKLGIDVKSITLGEAIISGQITESQKEKLNSAIKPFGLSLTKFPEYQYVKRVMVAVNHMLNHSLSEFKKELPAFINRDVDYSFLDDIFFKEEGKTIESYFIAKKAERAKELMLHYHLNKTEVAYQLGLTDENALIDYLNLSPVEQIA